MKHEFDFFRGLKWLMFFRVVFTTLLLGSTIFIQLGEVSYLSIPLLVLYGLIVFVFILSFIYAILIRWVKKGRIFAFFQLAMDTFVVTMIILVTGGFSSIFSFLYLLLIIFSSMLLFRKGSLLVAFLCVVQYAVLVALEYNSVINPFGVKSALTANYFQFSYVAYKVANITVACFGVALLSSFLSERERGAKQELKSMEEHVKRVEKMAVVGEMAAGLAHEIKNPLASLTGSVQILREELDYDPVRDKLMKIVLREADRLSTLVADFLMFARPPRGKVQPILLDRAVDDTVSLFEKDKNISDRISVVKDYAPDVWVEFDPSNLRQVLWNLLLNAAEAIEGDGRIDITVRNSGGHGSVEIADDGCGISPEQIKSIFSPFFTTKAEGTGLGLSIVHSILESYESTLDVESSQGRGTKMILKIKSAQPPTKA